MGSVWGVKYALTQSCDLGIIPALLRPFHSRGILHCKVKVNVKRANTVSRGARRRFSVFLALFVVIAVATIVITPDPTDDVDGILRSHHALKSPILGPSVGVSLVLYSLADLAASSPLSPTTPNLLRLICTCRC